MGNNVKDVPLKIFDFFVLIGMLKWLTPQHIVVLRMYPSQKILYWLQVDIFDITQKIKMAATGHC